MMRTGRLPGFCLALFSASLVAQAQEFKLKGRAVTELGIPIRWATVQLASARTQAYRQTRTNLEGKFSFKDLSPNLYILSVSANRLGTLRRSLDVTPSFANHKNEVEVTVVLVPPGNGERAQALGWTVFASQLTVPKKARRAFERAQKAGRQGDTADMLSHLREAIRLAPRYTDALNEMGRYLHHSGEYDQAVAYFEAAASAAPNAFAPRVNLGGALLSAGRTAEALEASWKALALREDDALANAQMGFALKELERFDEAVRFLERARRLDPGAPSFPQLLLAEIHLEQGDSEAALREWREFLNLHPDLPRSRLVRSKIERTLARAEAGDQ